MDISFWHEKWKNNNIGFHQNEANQLLVKHLSGLELAKESRVFVPLCGKTPDIAWLLANGYRVAGVELSEKAVKQLFEERGIKPAITAGGKLKRYSANNIDIYVGDIFSLTKKMLGPIDAVYDRAALVALPREMRKRYTAHLIAITDEAPQLLICYEYDQHLMEGPPFSISGKEIKQHYSDYFDLSRAASRKVQVKGLEAIEEQAWLLKNLS